MCTIPEIDRRPWKRGLICDFLRESNATYSNRLSTRKREKVFWEESRSEEESRKSECCPIGVFIGYGGSVYTICWLPIRQVTA